MVVLSTTELPPDYVSLSDLRDRWLKQQNEKKQREEENAGQKSGGDDSGKGVVELAGDGGKVGFRGFRERRTGRDGGDRERDEGRGEMGGKGNVGRRVEMGGKGRRSVEIWWGFSGFGEMKVDEGEDGDDRIYRGERRVGGVWERDEGDAKRGEVLRGYAGFERGLRANVGGGGVVEGFKGYGKRRFDEPEDVGEDCRRFGRGSGPGKGEKEVEKGNVMGGEVLEGSKVYGKRRVDEVDDVGGNRRRSGRGLVVNKRNVVDGEVLEGFKGYGKRRVDEMEDVGEDCRRFGRGSGPVKGEEVPKGDVMGREVLEGSKGYGKRRVNYEVDVRGKFGGLEMDDGRKGSVRYGRDRRRFGKGSGDGVEKKNVVNVREKNVVGVKVLESSKGNGKWVIDEVEHVGRKFGGLELSSEREGSDKYGGDRRRFGFVSGVWKGRNEFQSDVREENVVNVKMLEDSKVLVERRLNGRMKGKFGRDRRRLEKVSRATKGKNVIDVREESEVVEGNVVDVSNENVVDGKMSEVTEIVDIGKEFGDLTINGGGRKGKFKPGGDHRRFRHWKKKIYVRVSKGNEVEKPIPMAVKKENEVEKPIAVAVGGEKVDVKPISMAVIKENEGEKPIAAAVRGEDEVEKPILLAVRKENEVEKPIVVAVSGENEVEKSIPVAVRKKNEVEKNITVAVKGDNEAEKPIVVDVRVESEVEKHYLEDVKEENDAEKQIPVAVRDENEVEKQNLLNVKMSETLKGFGHRRGNEATGGTSEGFPRNGWRKGDKYGADKQAQVKTTACQVECLCTDELQQHYKAPFHHLSPCRCILSLFFRFHSFNCKL
ncbi:hypothetical protein ACET3Z_020247 [Daucus carota]